MLVHWEKVIWAKDGGSGTQWGPAIIFSEKKSTSLNPMRLSHKLTTVHNQIKSVHRANIEISSDEDDDYSDEVSWVFKTTVLKEESAHFF